ncbi:MAG: bifunctional acetate--CoA ligase family protein/GNAT family N-acetyltransferase [Desulfobacterales bacterium]|jgi:acetyltransferase
MGVYNLDRIFNPGAIAVIGASEKAGSVGSTLILNLFQSGFDGDLFPVNPRHKTIHGLKSLPSILNAERRIDLAVIATPIATVPSIVKECVQKGVKGAIIVSAGGKEAGVKGREIEAQIGKYARQGGLRIIGPNCLGIICPQQNLNASFVAHMPHKGNLAFISQSGAICSAILDLSMQEGFGFSHFVSIGSMVDVDFGDLIDFLGADPQVSSILLYVESLTNIRKFMSAARAVSRSKPIVVLKSGRSIAGTKAAASHTGAMAGEDSVYDAAFKRAGIVRVDTIGELFDCAELMARQPRPTGARLAVITNAGGPGVMAADALSHYGSEPILLSPDTISKLDAVLPSLWNRSNPIDILGDASPERYANAIEICVEAKEFDGLLVILSPQAMTDPTAVAEKLALTFQKKRYPLFTAWMGGVDVAKGKEILNQAGIPTYDTPEEAIRAFLYMVDYSRNLKILQEIPPKRPQFIAVERGKAREIIDTALDGKRPVLTELESKALLESYGLPVNRTEKAVSAQDALELANMIGYPLVMKILSPDILHKTDADGIRLDLRTEADVRKAYDEIISSAKAYDAKADIQGVTLQSMIRQPDYEILMGSKQDENFGPVILFGMGGIFTEALQDRAIGLPPLNVLLARQLMENTKIYSLLKGYRNRLPADMELVEEMILRLSQLVVDFPEIVELDMNPVMVREGKPWVVDARVILTSTKRPYPLHLVISPYPSELESREVTSDGLPIFVRPIRPEDAPLLINLFDTLSPTSIYYRFFGHLKSLPHSMLVRFTQVDYDREIDLVAVDDGDKNEERMLGVSRVFTDPDGKRAEFAILVGDPWQGKGVGARLLEISLGIAKNRGIETVWGTVLQENQGMLALGRKLGFKISKSAEPGEMELTIDLRHSKF